MPPRFALLLSLLCVSCSRPPDPLPSFPRLVLWALGTAGVAYLAATMTLTASGPEERHRLQPLWIPKDTLLIAVIRIESRTVLHSIHAKSIRALQINFDARVSELAFHGDLMTHLRRSLSPSIALEMTALVSWCQSADRIKRMPVVDAVPMFFRMGAEPHLTREHLREPLCAASIGTRQWALERDKLSPNICPGLPRPTRDARVDHYRDNWWCIGLREQHLWAQGRLPRRTKEPPPAVLTARERADTAQESQKLQAAGTAPEFLSAAIVSWVRKHPDNPRNAEALAVAVKTSRFTCVELDQSYSIEQAFHLLHERYPNRTWANTTPYWY